MPRRCNAARRRAPCLSAVANCDGIPGVAAIGGGAATAGAAEEGPAVAATRHISMMWSAHQKIASRFAPGRMVEIIVFVMRKVVFVLLVFCLAAFDNNLLAW